MTVQHPLVGDLLRRLLDSLESEENNAVTGRFSPQTWILIKDAEQWLRLNQGTAR